VTELKKSKKILCIVNLILFLGSFSLFTINSLANSKGSQSADHVPQHITSRQDAITDGSSQQLSEKNETENEGDFELQALTLPFSLSFFQFEIAQPVIQAAQPLAEKTVHPIYVSVCNFRI